MLQIFSFNGPVNHLLEIMGFEPVQFFQKADLFRGFIIGSDVWKSFGFNSIIYLAALTGIDNTLYEAAEMDGAGRWRKMWHVTLPGIRSTSRTFSHFVAWKHFGCRLRPGIQLVQPARVQHRRYYRYLCLSRRAAGVGFQFCHSGWFIEIGRQLYSHYYRVLAGEEACGLPIILNLEGAK